MISSVPTAQHTPRPPAHAALAICATPAGGAAGSHLAVLAAVVALGAGCKEEPGGAPPVQVRCRLLLVPVNFASCGCCPWHMQTCPARSLCCRARGKRCSSSRLPRTPHPPTLAAGTAACGARRCWKLPPRAVPAPSPPPMRAACWAAQCAWRGCWWATPAVHRPRCGCPMTAGGTAGYWGRWFVCPLPVGAAKEWRSVLLRGFSIGPVADAGSCVAQIFQQPRPRWPLPAAPSRYERIRPGEPAELMVLCNDTSFQSFKVGALGHPLAAHLVCGPAAPKRDAGWTHGPPLCLPLHGPRWRLFGALPTCLCPCRRSRTRTCPTRGCGSASTRTATAHNSWKCRCR